MKIYSARSGLATNSSSTHSIIFRSDAQDYDIDGDFGWNHFTAASEEARRMYLGVMVYSTLRESLDHHNAILLTNDLVGMSMEEDGDGISAYIDHQSLCLLPRSRVGHGIDVEFLSDFRDYLLQDGLVILGGNDNDDSDHPLGIGREFPIPTEIGGLVARKDGAYWTLFNQVNGAKIRLSFNDAPPYTHSTLPELVDVKITNKCGGGCKWCYQDSTADGEEATSGNLWRIIEALSSIGVFEIAIGGGDAMTHYGLSQFMASARKYGIVPNLTVHNIDWMTIGRIADPIMKSVGGVAYSIASPEDVINLAAVVNIAGISPSRVSVHHVVGTEPSTIVTNILSEAARHRISIVLLGYKGVGRGANFSPYQVDICRVINALDRRPTISMDTTLAQMCSSSLRNMNVADILYETHDGTFSMYIDAVRMKCGPSSYCPDDRMVDIDPMDVEGSITEAYRSWNE